MAKDARIVATMECSECKGRHHHTSKRTKGQGVKRIELKKFCPVCNKSVLHKETK